MVKNKRKFFKENYVVLIEREGRKIPLLALASLTLLLLGTNIFVTPPQTFPRIGEINVQTSAIPENSLLKTLDVNAAAAIVYDPKSGVVLYEKNADTPIPPASTTKVVTALVTLENYNLDEVLNVPSMHVDGQKMGLVMGEKMTVENLLNGMLIFSANDAAEVFADDFPAGRDKFIEKMNELAQKLDLKNTRFKNPSGLFEDGHVSTARDLARLGAYSVTNPIIAQIVKTKEKTVTSVDGVDVHKLVNLNSLLRDTPGVLGIKTGRTDEGGESLITFVNRDGKELIIVVLGSVDRFGDTKSLLNWAYGNYRWANPGDITAVRNSL